MRAVRLVLLLNLVWLPIVHAQYTADFQTNIISGVTSNWSGDYFVGNTLSADALLIQSNGVLSDTRGYLGYDSSSSNNSALVTDVGSIWSNSILYVGFEGRGNNLIVSNGAQVFNASYGYVGGGNIPRVSDNSAVIT